MKKYAIVLAAGKGTRMKSLNQEKSKVAFEIFEKPLVNYVLDSLNSAHVNEIVVVAGFGGEETKKLVESKAKVVFQKEINGTAKAVESAKEELSTQEGSTIVICGDTPLIREETILNLFNYHESNKNDMTIATMILDNPQGYGRIVRRCNEISKIVEHKDATDEEKQIREVNSGLYVFNNKLLFEYLPLIKANNNQNEYYLTDIVSLFNESKKKVGGYIVDDYKEMLGINDRKQLSEARKVIQDRVNNALMLSGVTIEDPETTYIAPGVIVGQDSVIAPNTSILGNSVIGVCNYIGPNSYLKNAKIGNHNNVFSSWLTDFVCGDNNEIGPYTKTRAGTILENGCRVGNFVELKDAHFHDGVKCAHLTYIGDAEIGEHTNIGCGSITANYDGFNKMRTTVGKDCFVGSGTILVAPVKMEDKTFTAAGSTITKDVKEDTMAIARARQVDLEHGYTIFRAKAKAKKEADAKEKK